MRRPRHGDKVQRDPVGEPPRRAPCVRARRRRHDGATRANILPEWSHMSYADFTAVVCRTSRVAHGEQQVIDLVSGREHVPAVWLSPAAPAPAPAVVLLHGLSSNKERMAQAVGRALL